MDQNFQVTRAIVNLAKLDSLCISHLIGNGVAMESRSGLATIQKSVKKSSFEGSCWIGRTDQSRNQLHTAPMVLGPEFCRGTCCHG